jgi:hypothetical protein
MKGWAELAAQKYVRDAAKTNPQVLTKQETKEEKKNVIIAM